jgi:hypothetical protein
MEGLAPVAKQSIDLLRQALANTSSLQLAWLRSLDVSLKRFQNVKGNSACPAHSYILTALLRVVWALCC